MILLNSGLNDTQYKDVQWGVGEESANFQGFVNDRAHRGFGDLGRMVIYFQGAGEHW